MISLQKLTKYFGSQTAVDGLSFDVPAGQIVGFLGPNGAGKSTTLKMLTAMIEPSAGTATVCGFDLRHDSLEVKRHVGFVPESAAVFESLTGLEYLEMVAALYSIPRNAARDRIEQFIAFFDLGFVTLTDKLLGAYSKGMRRKVVIRHCFCGGEAHAACPRKSRHDPLRASWRAITSRVGRRSARAPPEYLLCAQDAAGSMCSSTFRLCDGGCAIQSRAHLSC